ncbi:MAG: FAD-binding oxidoreductase [Gemmataceae bacterium]|nr:FAD-binding oxidoreductase [Gemmataceae bacterium]
MIQPKNTGELGMEVRKPASVEEAGEIIRRAAQARAAIFPFGNDSKRHIGFTPSKMGLRLNTLNLNRLVDYPARDMTVTVQAGISMKLLRGILAKEGQCLPVDDPCPDQSTLGGMLAVNCNGPRRFGWGTLRDYVIGISVINDEGKETKAGGRVVKNVAGYDFCKLHTGALGTLGLISQVTLKVRPKPESSAMAVIGLNQKDLEPALDLVHGTATRPVSIDILNQAAVRHLKPDSSNASKDWTLLIGFEHNEKAVAWQCETLMEEVRQGLGRETQVIPKGKDQAIWESLARFQAAPPADSQATFKINVAPAKVAAFATLIDETFPLCPVQAHAGSGILFGHVPGALPFAEVHRGIQSLLEKAKRSLGNLTILHCHEDWKNDLPVWGAPRDDLFLMRKVKESLDPMGLFNPGRFVDRI